MFCPLCIQLQIQSKITALPGVYVCENDICEFCETTVDYEFLNSLQISTIEHGNVILQDKEYNSNDVKLLNNTNDNIKFLFEEFERACDGIVRKDATEDECRNHENVEYCCTSIDSHIMNESRVNVFHSYNESELLNIDKCVSENYSIILRYKTKNIFNWLRLPNAFNTHYTIIRILMLHLDVFKINGVKILDAKYEYAACQLFANYLSKEQIKHFGYGLIKKIYYILNMETKYFDQNYDMVLNLLISVFNNYDIEKNICLEYETLCACKFCGQQLRTNSSHYILKLENHFSISENVLTSEITCSECKNICSKKINFIKVPEFVIFYFSNGFDGNLNLFENQIKSSANQYLSVVGVVEYESEYPSKSDTLLSRELYEIGSSIKTSDSTLSYCFHFRNKNGWYSLNDFVPLIAKPTNNLFINNNKNVRLIIFGKVSDPNVYYETFYFEQFILAHKEYFTKNVLRTCKSNELWNYCNEVIKKSNVKKSRSRKVYKYSTKVETSNEIFPEDNNSCTVDLDIDYPDLSSEQSNAIYSINQPLSNSQISNYSVERSSSNTSGVSSSSSIFDYHTSSNRQNEISSNSNCNSINFIDFKKTSNKRALGIDDLVNQYHKKLKKDKFCI